MNRNCAKTAPIEGPYKMEVYPASEISHALGLRSAHRDSLDYNESKALHARLIEVCTRCAIRFGIPDQARAHIGDSIGLPNEPVLRHPHQAIACDPRWEMLAKALRLPVPGSLPLVDLEMPNRESLEALKKALPLLIEDLDLKLRPAHQPPTTPVFRPISHSSGNALVDKLDKVSKYGEDDHSEAGYNREIAHNIERQMRIYKILGPQWTLVNAFESIALSACALPDSPRRLPPR